MNLDSDFVGTTMQCPMCRNAFEVKPPQAPTVQPVPSVQSAPNMQAMGSEQSTPNMQGMGNVPPVPNTQGMPISSYPAQQPFGGFAPVPPDPGKPALILGIVSLIFGGLIGLICSIIGLSFAKKSPKNTGYVLNMIALVWSLIVFVIIAILLLGPPRERARRANCVSNLKNIGLAIMMYANNNKDYTPSGKGQDSLDLLIKGGYMPGAAKDGLMKCPSSDKQPSYAYVGEGLVIGRDNPGLPIVVEYPTNHDSLFADRVVNVCFLGGHVSTISIPEDCQTISQVVKYALQQENADSCYCRNDYYRGKIECGRCKVLENAKQY